MALDSFSRSALGAFNESPLGVRGGAVNALYMLGGVAQDIFQYDVADDYLATGLSYTGQFIDVSTESGTNGPKGVALGNDGTKMYMLSDNITTQDVRQYTLSAAWDVSTATYDSVTYNAVAEGNLGREVRFNDDGTKMYVLFSNPDTIFQYTLSSAWDVSTASYASKSLSIFAKDIDPTSFAWKPDGTKVYVSGSQNDSIYQYDLSTAWDISSGSWVSTLDASSEATDPWGVAILDSGTKVYVLDDTNDKIYQYTLSTAWDLSTGSYDSKEFSVASEDASPRGIFHAED